MENLKIITLKEIDSTNNYAKVLLNKNCASFPLLITSNKQTKGRGYGSNIWFSEQGKNIMCTYMLKNFILKKYNIFYVNIIFSIAIKNVISEATKKNVSIKWPNDILVENRKICGILIENIVQKDNVISLVGIGLNVNQTSFPNFEREATSLKKETKKSFDAKYIIERLNYWIKATAISSYKCNYTHYLSSLYLKGKINNFIINNSVFRASIQGVTQEGLLVILTDLGIKKIFSIKEIKFLK